MELINSFLVYSFESLSTSFYHLVVYSTKRPSAHSTRIASGAITSPVHPN